MQFQKHKFIEECIHKALMEHCLNQYLIYFKTVESSVHSSLEKLSNKKMGSTKMEDLLQLSVEPYLDHTVPVVKTEPLVLTCYPANSNRRVPK